MPAPRYSSAETPSQNAVTERHGASPQRPKTSLMCWSTSFLTNSRDGSDARILHLDTAVSEGTGGYHTVCWKTILWTHVASMDGRVVRLSFEALMAPICKRRRDLGVVNAGPSNKREPQGCCLLIEHPNGQMLVPQTKSQEFRDGQAEKCGDLIKELFPVSETFALEFSAWPSTSKTVPRRVRLSIEKIAQNIEPVD